MFRKKKKKSKKDENKNKKKDNNKKNSKKKSTPKKTKGLFRISKSEDLSKVLNTQLPFSEFSESIVDSVPMIWREKCVNDWVEDDLSQFFLFLQCKNVISAKILEDSISGTDFLKETVFKGLLKLIKSIEKKKVLSLYYYFFLYLKELNKPIQMSEGFDIMVLKIAERHPADNLLNKCNLKVLARMVYKLIDKERVKKFYFSDNLLVKTINFKKFRIMVGTEDKNAQFFGLFFHPCLVLIHSDASFSQIYWLESEEDDRAMFRDNFDQEGKKFSLRDVEYKLLESFETNIDEEKVVNGICRIMSRCNKLEKRLEAPEFIEKLVLKITNFVSNDTDNLVDKYSPLVRSHISVKKSKGKE